jgi:hypothetical protein
VRAVRSPALAAALAALAATALAACVGVGGVGGPPPEGRFGYRLAGDDLRATVGLAAPDSVTRYLLLPAVIDDVEVRAAGRPAPGDAVAVEVVVEGAFPGLCDELAAARQDRAGRFVTVALVVRQPRERVCAAVTRPFRYYLPLDGAFEAGSYTLDVNGRVLPFQVLPALADGAEDG